MTDMPVGRDPRRCCHVPSSLRLCPRRRARARCRRTRRLSGDDRFSNLARLREVEDLGQLIPKVRALFEATYIAGLRKAGMPEE